MLARFVDRIEARLEPHMRAVSYLAAIWFWVGIAFQARFLSLPDLPRALDLAIFWGGVAFNAIWWGFLRPAIKARQAARLAAAEPGAASPG